MDVYIHEKFIVIFHTVKYHYLGPDKDVFRIIDSTTPPPLNVLAVNINKKS